MSAVKLYTTPWCPYCIRAKQILTSKGFTYDDVDVSRDTKLRQEMEKRSGRRTVPQIWIGGKHIGGCDELSALDRAGKLESLLTA